jgi:hypothetical protein
METTNEAPRDVLCIPANHGGATLTRSADSWRKLCEKNVCTDTATEANGCFVVLSLQIADLSFFAGRTHSHVLKKKICVRAAFVIPTFDRFFM